MLFDSYAWVEFFQKSEEGVRVKEILEDLGSVGCFTSIVSLSEITEWCLKNNRDFDKRIEIIMKLSTILNLNEEIVKLAGKINFENKRKINNWGMLDSLIYATASIYGLKVLTGDEHFRDLDNVEML